ncbi:MAG: putative sugar nucleotidyl transferase [Planctomycetota bacterium]
MKHETEQAKLVVFDDGRGRFGPLTQVWPAFAIRSGALRGTTRIANALQRRVCGGLVPETHVAIAREAYADIPINQLGELGAVLAVNGRWSGMDRTIVEAIENLRPGDALTTPQGDLLAAYTTGETLEQLGLEQLSAEHASWGGEQRVCEAELFARPWDVLNTLDDRITADIARLGLPVATDLPHGVTRVGGHAIHAHHEATVSPHVHLDTALGPIAIDQGAIVHPFTVIEGPCYLGPHAVVAANATLRAGCAIGKGCKVGGELKAAVLDDFSNKAHFGYLGNALVGRWCNLGAGTTASNLKNTWGEVRMQLEPGDDPEPTGRAFLGPVLGDFVRTAIGTTLPTGAVIDAAACLVASGFAPKYVPALTFLTDEGPQATDLSALQRTLERMMQRRDQAPTDPLMQRLGVLSEANSG